MCGVNSGATENTEEAMPVIRDFTVQIDLHHVAGQRGGFLSRLAARPAWQDMYRSAVSEAAHLLRPAIAYAVLPVTGTEQGRLRIGDGAYLESPVVARLLASAQDVVLAAFSIGPLLEERVASHQAAGEYPAGFALDIAGAIAVGEVGKVAFQAIDELAVSRGLRASIPLNPGTTHWPLSGNHVFAKLIPTDEIGVEVLDSGLLRPFKSISYAVGLGKDVLTPEQGSSCDYCDTRDLCRQW